MTTQESIEVSALANADVIGHLLFHKAMIDDEDDGTRVNRYLEMVADGEHVTMHDPFDRSIALAFELVIQEELDPWDIDLVRFSTMYLERAEKEEVDLVTAGRVILLAWTVLRMQSDDLVRRTAARQEESMELDWDELPEWDLSDEDVDYTHRVRMSPRAPIDEKVWHKGDRKVTLMELMDAFELARDEADLRQSRAKSRASLRADRAATARSFTRNRVHKEDLEEDIAVVWSRICGRNGDAIALSALCDPTDLDDLVMTFNSVLFLHRDRRIDVWQERFPFGEIFLRNRHAQTAVRA